MMKVVIWNIRAVRTQKAFHRVHMLNNHHKFWLIDLLEPFQRATQIQKYKGRLRMNNAGKNSNGKIWFFVADNIYVEIMMDIYQQITLRLFFQDLDIYCITSLVYAKCLENEKLALWDSIYHLTVNKNLLCLVGGDFNVILNEEENLGGLPATPQECEDFSLCVNSSDFEELHF